MTPERWKQIERIYHEALARDGAERPAFLRDACAGDEALREEVASLLEVEPKAQTFMEQPALAGGTPLSAVANTIRQMHEPALPGRLTGRTFGAYELEYLIAAGGMGEVYRARDTRLGRTVAVKILPAHLAADPERRERFGREAKMVSSIEHPHVCALYDVGVQDGMPYLVMEHLDGETLEARLARGALPWPKALEYLVQIVDALDKAHRRGVVHRDLKPANVMLTKAGAKLLDFGIAVWTRPGEGLTPPTEDEARLTQDGRIIGTLRYLSPEQLQGKPPDARSDLFAVGLLASEMLPGSGVPPVLTSTISRCLARDPDERWQTPGDLLFQLRSIGRGATHESGERAPAAALPRGVERVMWAAAVLVAALLTSLWLRGGPGPPVPAAAPPAVRFSIDPGPAGAFASGFDIPFALSPDGRHLAYVSAAPGEPRQLWLYTLQTEARRRLAGTDGAGTPFWSPDGEWIGFFAARSLRKVRVSTGVTQTIASDVSTLAGAAWSRDDVILFPDGPGGLSRVSARGGEVTQVTGGEGSHFWPRFLPDGRHFLYVAAMRASLELGSLDGQQPRALMTFPVRVSAIDYVPGHVLFVQDGALYARPFDERTLAFAGEPRLVQQGIPVTGPGRAPFSAAATGVLAWWPYPHGTPAILQWLDRSGRASTAVDVPAQYLGFDVSPGGARLVASRVSQGGGADLWVRDLARGADTQVTFDGAAFTPRWSADGTAILFSGPGHRPPPRLFVRRLEPPGEATQVGDSPLPNFASDWTADASLVVSVRIDPEHRNDLWIQRAGDPRGERLPVNSPANESHGRLSPDGRWIAYVTEESGTPEVWIASFPSGGVRRQVSTAGGTMPQWTRGGAELVYASEANEILAAAVRASGEALDVGRPQILFRIPDLVEVDRLVVPTSNSYVADPSGERFLAAVRAPDPQAPPIHVVVNWLGAR